MTTKKTTLSILSSLLLAPILCNAQAAKKEASFRAIPLAATNSKKHHCVKVMIEGSPQYLVVDSGLAGTFVISTDVANQLSKKLTPSGHAKTIAGNTRIFSTSFDSIQFGSAIKLKNFKATVAALPAHLSLGIQVKKGEETKVEQAAGLLGSTFLLRARSIISYKHNSILVPPNGLDKNAYRNSRAAAGDKILALQPGHKKRPFIKVSIKGKSYQFLVDTAAGSNVITPEVVKELGLKTKKSKTEVVGGGKGKATNPDFALVDNVTFAEKIKLPKFDFYVIPNHAKVKAPDGGSYGGIIGSSLLIQLKAELDYESYSLIVPRRK